MSNNQNNNKYNKVVLITGAARRIGAVIAQYFHEHGYSIIIHYRSQKSEVKAKQLSDTLNAIRANSCFIIQAELGSLVDPDFVEKFTLKVKEFFGRIDVLVNNASSFFPTPIGKITLNDWRDLMISNAGGPFFLAQGLAPHLQATKGCIINISDIHAQRPLKGYSVYSMAKAANNMMTKALARELAPAIRVNAVAPGPSLQPDEPDGAENSAFIEHNEYNKQMVTKTLLKRLSSPLDIAQAVLFLAEAQSITGQILALDGGRSVRL